jgi:aspartate/methionine/tyrosine aminotransferase
MDVMNQLRTEEMAAEGSGITARREQPSRLIDMQIPGRVQKQLSARESDLRLIAKAPAGFLDTTHFDTVRFPPPDWAHEVFAKAAQDGDMAYSGYRGHTHVLAAVAENLSAFLTAEIEPRHIILTPGTQAGLFGALSALVEPGDRVALGCPEYLFSERILRFLGADVAPIPLHTFDALQPSLDLDVLESEFRDKGTRLLVFSHPNNPTGSVYRGETLAAIAKLAVRYDVTVIVDELYARLLHGSQPLHHLRSEPGMAERTVTLLGPSKTESLSGYRLGVVVAPEAIIKRMENMLSIMALRAPAYAQTLLVHWLRDDKAWLAERLPAFTALRSLTETKLTRLPWLRLSMGGGTAYAWPDLSRLQMPSDQVAELLLTKAGVLVSPGYQFGPGCDAFLRVCYARDETIWSDALDRMVSVLDDVARRRGLAGMAG